MEKTDQFESKPPAIGYFTRMNQESLPWSVTFPHVEDFVSNFSFSKISDYFQAFLESYTTRGPSGELLLIS